MGSDVGLGDLERGASSNIGGEGTKVDTATSAPSSSQPSVPAVVRAFHALKEKRSLKIEVFSKFKDRFQFPEGTRAHLPRKDEKACAFAYGEVCFYEAVFSCGFRFLVHPFITKLLHHLNLAPRITSSSLGIESLVSSLIYRRPSVTGSSDFFYIGQRLGDSF